MAALKRQAGESQAQAESALREADRERRAAVILQDKVDALERRLADEEAAAKNVSKRWNHDVELMQTQLQTEVEARIAAEHRLLEVEANFGRDTQQEASAGASSNQAGEDEQALCTKCPAREELVSELQSAVALLNDQLSAVYREKAAGEKEREWEHAKALSALKDEMAEQLTAARDAQAFSEKIAKRLEHELLKQSQAILQQQQASRQQASGLKRRMGGGKQHAEFRDFSAEVERLTGGGNRLKAPSASTGQGAHTPREPADQEAVHTQLPVMPPAHSSSGSFRPASGRAAGVVEGGGRTGGGGAEVRLGEIRKPTPPIGGGGGGGGGCGASASGAHSSHRRRGAKGHACPSLNLADIERHGNPVGASGGDGSMGTAVTERTSARGGWRQDGQMARGARHLLPSTAR